MSGVAWRRRWCALSGWAAERLAGGRAPWVSVRRGGFRWRLHREHYLDREILYRGEFEAATTAAIRRRLRPGMFVLDVGANFGYYALLMGRLVGAHGKVWAFEPVREYRERLAAHLQANGLTSRVEVLPWALSDSHGNRGIWIGNSSATFHPPGGTPASGVEEAPLRMLDSIAAQIGLSRLDFVKVDIDGHEPAFLRGGQETLRRHRPPMVIEFNQANLQAAGGDVTNLKVQLEELGYVLCSERTGRPFASREEFLAECGDPSRSANVWAERAAW